jgi:hypothetical protein
MTVKYVNKILASLLYFTIVIPRRVSLGMCSFIDVRKKGRDEREK